MPVLGRLALVFALGIAACGDDDAPVVLVDVVTDWLPGTEFDSVRGELRRAGEVVETRSRSVSGGPEDGRAFREGLRLAQFPSTLIDGRRLWIGADSSSPGNPSSYFSGRIDDLRIYSRALSSTEVAAIMAL